MQAQAQECIVEKSLVDGRSPNAVAKLALQAALQYEELYGMLEGHALAVCPGGVPSTSGAPNVATASLLAEVLSSRFASTARNRSEAKAHYLRALAYFYAGAAHSRELQSICAQFIYIRLSLIYIYTDCSDRRRLAAEARREARMGRRCQELRRASRQICRVRFGNAWSSCDR